MAVRCLRGHRSRARYTASLSERFTRAPIGLAIQVGGGAAVDAAFSFRARARRSDTSRPRDFPSFAWSRFSSRSTGSSISSVVLMGCSSIEHQMLRTMMHWCRDWLQVRSAASVGSITPLPEQLLQPRRNLALDCEHFAYQLRRVLVGHRLRHARLVPRGSQVVVVLRNSVKGCPPAAGLLAAGVEHRAGLDARWLPVAGRLVLAPGHHQSRDVVLLRRLGTAAALDPVRVVAVVPNLVEPDAPRRRPAFGGFGLRAAKDEDRGLDAGVGLEDPRRERNHGQQLALAQQPLTQVLVRLGGSEQRAFRHDHRASAAGGQRAEHQGEEEQLALLRLGRQVPPDRLPGNLAGEGGLERITR